MYESPNQALSHYAGCLQQATGAPLIELAPRIGWGQSQTSLQRFMTGAETIRLNDAKPIAASLAREFQVELNELWQEVLYESGHHMLLSALAKGEIWNVTPDNAELRAKHVSRMAYDARRVQMITSRFPEFLLPQNVITETLMGVLNSRGRTDVQVLKAQRRFTSHLQNLFELGGSTTPAWMICLGDDALRSIREHKPPFDTLKARDVEEIRLELINNWVPRGFLFAVFPALRAAHLTHLLRWYQWLMVFDDETLIAQLIPGFNPICCRAASEFSRRCVVRHSRSLSELLKYVPYQLTSSEVIRVINELLT